MMKGTSSRRLASALVVALALLASPGTVQTQVPEVCDATCTGPDPFQCTTWVSYVCSTCIIYRYCPGWLGLPPYACWDFAESGTKYTHQVCQGVHADTMENAPCGQCFG